MYQVKMMDIHILGSATLNTDIHNSPAAAATSNTTPFIIAKLTEWEKKINFSFHRRHFDVVVTKVINVLFHLKEQLRPWRQQNKVWLGQLSGRRSEWAFDGKSTPYFRNGFSAECNLEQGRRNPGLESCIPTGFSELPGRKHSHQRPTWLCESLFCLGGTKNPVRFQPWRPVFQHPPPPPPPPHLEELFRCMWVFLNEMRWFLSWNVVWQHVSLLWTTLLDLPPQGCPNQSSRVWPIRMSQIWCAAAHKNLQPHGSLRNRLDISVLQGCAFVSNTARTLCLCCRWRLEQTLYATLCSLSDLTSRQELYRVYGLSHYAGLQRLLGTSMMLITPPQGWTQESAAINRWTPQVTTQIIWWV